MSDVNDHEPFGDGEEEDLSGAKDDFEEDGKNEIDDGDVVLLWIQWGFQFKNRGMKTSLIIRWTQRGRNA